jgi:hypothetical protein
MVQWYGADGIMGKEGEAMAIPIEQTERTFTEETFKQRLARLRASPEERARILASSLPFDYDAWVREAGPPTSEELIEMEEFLRERA